MDSIASILKDATKQLLPVSDTPALDAELLLAHALGIDRSELLLRRADYAAADGFADILKRRLADEPVAYILGTQPFWTITLHVTPDVLIPRSDSETLIEAAIEVFAGKAPPTQVIDLGTGSGALLLAALTVFPDAAGIGIDASEKALAVARLNASELDLNDRADFRRLDWRQEDWKARLGQADLLFCNPPYIENDALLAPMVLGYEPHGALFGGADGLDHYRLLLPQLAALLKPEGIAIFEIGYRQAAAVIELGHLAGLSTHLHHDLSENPRAVRFSLGIGHSNS